jgi:hypothetical protein
LEYAACSVTDVPVPPRPEMVTLPAWLITTTAATGDEIWYTVVALCVPGIDRLGLALAAAACDPAVDADAGLAALPDWHPASASPSRLTRPAISARPLSGHGRRIAAPARRIRSIPA